MSIRVEQCVPYPHKPHPYTDLYEFGKRHTEVNKWCPGSVEDWSPEDEG